MKLFLLFEVLVICVFSFSCNKDRNLSPDKDTSAIVGTWQLDSIGFHYDDSTNGDHALLVQKSSYFIFQNDNLFYLHVLFPGDKDYNGFYGQGIFNVKGDSAFVYLTYDQPVSLMGETNIIKFKIKRNTKSLTLTTAITEYDPGFPWLSGQQVGSSLYYFSK